MNRIFISTSASLLFAASLLFSGACGDKPGADPAGGKSAGTVGSGGGLPDKIKVKDPAKNEILKIKPKGDDLKLEFAGAVWKGESKSPEKRKYAPEGGATAYEIKADADGFKLRTADGRLLWKVKFKDDKVKLSDNEEGLLPYQLKYRGDKVKIYDDETEIGAVKFYDDKSKVKDAANTERFAIKPVTRSGAYGVLIMERIPATERYILTAELLVRGK